MSAIDVLQDVIDRIEDEGDRCFLGSTNDVERLKDVIAEIGRMQGELANEARDLMRDLRSQMGA